jgi:hypothetical protein
VSGTVLNYGELRTAIQENRFPSSDPISDWLGAAYSDVWNAANWTFKRVSRANLYTTADGLSSGTPSATPSMPAAFADITSGVFDDTGCKLKQLTEFEFERLLTEQTPTTGRPSHFMVVNRQITFWPTPASAYLFKVSYRRRLATRTSVGAVQAGFFQNDTDLPLWDDHHYLLVLRAKLIGLRDRSDPTASDLEGEFSRLLSAMQTDYVEARPIGATLARWR